ncbi:hypothetical protein SLEP1_g30749 [Rubroshorea leprosula]|uniref:Fe2OG dioxygenase domain-containing protein n=1 Tax=Rubroshorea leprosula TaxID=152421 RepID=A0AAV5K9S4_9ROSI|nr:hypothetical protein SLEP1_g30749 [Rubroshorea leprosula]
MATIPPAEYESRVLKEVNEFMESGIGVKGLVDSGVSKLPSFFVHPLEQLPKPSSEDVQFRIPLIDLKEMETSRRVEIVSQIRDAAENWGIFQLVNHGVPIPVMDQMIDGVHQFNEQPVELKKEWLAAHLSLHYNLNRLPLAAWRDSLACNFPDEKIDEEAIPQICRKAIIEYTKYVLQLKDTLSELSSEALGLKSNYLESIKCMKSAYLISHYYPACPQPELTMGSISHTDSTFLTILLQDSIGGLQVLHQNQWVDVPCVPGSLTINYGDLMQLITNGKFKAARHRVVAKSVGPRISAAFFFSPAVAMCNESYGPLKELVSKENPPIFKPISSSEYFARHRTQLDKDTNTSGLSELMLSY